MHIIYATWLLYVYIYINHSYTYNICWHDEQPHDPCQLHLLLVSNPPLSAAIPVRVPICGLWMETLMREKKVKTLGSGIPGHCGVATISAGMTSYYLCQPVISPRAAFRSESFSTETKAMSNELSMSQSPWEHREQWRSCRWKQSKQFVDYLFLLFVFHLFLNQRYLAECNLGFRDSSRLQTMPKE